MIAWADGGWYNTAGFLSSSSNLVVEGAVPVVDGAGLALPAEDAERAGAEAEVLAAAGVEGDPAGGEDAQDVGVGEERDLAGVRRSGEGAGDDRVGALADVLGRFAVDEGRLQTFQSGSLY